MPGMGTRKPPKKKKPSTSGVGAAVAAGRAVSEEEVSTPQDEGTQQRTQARQKKAAAQVSRSTDAQVKARQREQRIRRQVAQAQAQAQAAIQGSQRQKEINKGQRDVSGLPKPPPDTGPEDTRTYLGVEKGYTAQVSRGIQQGAEYVETVAPQYTANDAENVLGNLSGTEELATIQARLKAAGFIPGRTKYSTGDWDTPTETALKNLMGQANRMGATWEDLLDKKIPADTDLSKFGGDTGDGSGGGGGGGGTTSNLPDAEHVRQIIDQTGQDTIGRNVDPAIREQILNEVNNEVTNATSTYDLDANIRRKIKEKFSGESQAHDIYGVLDTFGAMLGVGGGFGNSLPSFGKSNVGPATGSTVGGTGAWR